MQAHYMKITEWEKEWIKVAIALLEETWRKFYWPTANSADRPLDEPLANTLFLGITLYMDLILLLIDAMQQPAESLVHTFVYDTPVFNVVGSKCVPFNLLVWWYGQCVVGNERDGLTQLALDVLSAPTSSVDVERVFLFAGLIISKHQHNLSPHTIQATTTLGSYSKAGLVKPGTLQLLLCGREKEKEGV